MSVTIADRLKALGLSLPDAPAPVANYVPYLIAGDLLFVSGQISKAPDGTIVTGRLGADITVEQGQKAAHYCALNILAQANAALGSLDRIAQVMRLTGYVASTPDAGDQPAVINGASSSIYISAQTADVTADAGTNALAGITVGSAFDQTSDPLNGKVAEVMLYSRALSASERLSILRYSSTRYGTAVGA